MYLASNLPALLASSKCFCLALKGENSAFWVRTELSSHCSLFRLLRFGGVMFCLNAASATWIFFSKSSCFVMLDFFLKEACCIIWPLIKALNTSHATPADGADARLVSTKRFIWALKNSLKLRSSRKLELSLHLGHLGVLYKETLKLPIELDSMEEIQNDAVMGCYDPICYPSPPSKSGSLPYRWLHTVVAHWY